MKSRFASDLREDLWLALVLAIILIIYPFRTCLSTVKMWWLVGVAVIIAFLVTVFRQ